MSTLPTRPLYVLDDDDSVVSSFVAVGARLVEANALLEAFQGANADACWIASRWDVIAPLAALSHATRPAYGLLLTDRLATPEPVLQEGLRPYFERIVAPSRSTALLELGEAAAVITSEVPGDYVLAAHFVGNQLLLVRGSLDLLAVPLRSFRPTSSGRLPDIRSITIIDQGLALAFGDYESTVDVILYEHDAEYRQRAKRRERDHDMSFGAALRRLRLLRGLSQSAFSPLDARDIQRLEANEITQPNEGTRRILAERLGVPFEEIVSF